MKTAVFSTYRFERELLQKEATGKHELVFIEAPLSVNTALLAQGCEAVCIFVNDDASEKVLQKLHELGIKFLVLRSAGFNHLDLETANKLGMRAARVPEYSPYAVAEHTVALMLALNRKLVRANSRVRDGNFSLDGLTGFDMHGKTAGIIGLGKIGRAVASIMKGFGCRLLGSDPFPDQKWVKETGIRLTDIDSLCRESDIITLHAPLFEETKYMINKERIGSMKKGVMLINTSRGGLVDTKAVIAGLKSLHIGYLGLDVYEEEKGLFFEDHSSEILQDDVITRLMTFPNVLITSHQGFLTDTALQNIAGTTVENLDHFSKGTFGVGEIKLGKS
jgi:D-lactate dehydrogenase